MFRRKIRTLAAAASAFALLTGTAWLVGQGQAEASTPLPPFPATTPLDLGSPNCVTDDVIMNDVTAAVGEAPGALTFGSEIGDGIPVVDSHATPPVTYDMWYLNSSNVWVTGPPPGVQLNPITGEISAYNGAAGPPSPPGSISGDVHPNGGPASGTITYTVRDHGKDAVGAKGTEQFQLRVNDSAGGPTVAYGGNDFDNSQGALTIGLNAGSTTSTSLTLAPIVSSLHIPGSTPVVFSLVSSPGWNLSATDVLTGTSASDPEIKAVTEGSSPSGPFDVVFFTLSGISTTSSGVFFINNDVNPCVNTAPAPVPTPSPSPTSTGTGTPPPAMGNFGNEVNAFGNGFDVFRQHYAAGAIIAGWPANNADPATLFDRINRGSGVWQFEATRAGGVATGLCVSDPGGGWPDPVPDGLILTPCNTGPWQQFRLLSGEPSQLQDVATGLVVRPDGTGAQLRGSATAIGGTSDHYTWKDNAHLP